VENAEGGGDKDWPAEEEVIDLLRVLRVNRFRNEGEI
jgi:hypothetical protein